jgi:predicted dehydrogenase
VLLDSLVHEVNALRGIMGEPEKVLFTDIWKDGEGFTTILRFPNEIECTLSWVNLTELPNYSQELAFYSPDKRVSIKFPSPFLRNEPTPVHVEEMSNAGSWEQVVKVSHEEAFKQELVHLHSCIINGVEPITNGLSAKRDIAVLQTMIKSWQSKKPEVIPTF